ncbi:MAG: FtsQ-type POTRA domain-containing protein [Hyphomicrobiaceae bacterium]
MQLSIAPDALPPPCEHPERVRSTAALWYGPTRHSQRRRQFLSRRSKLVLAGLSGAAMFAALSGFGQNVRTVEPLGHQLDAMLAAAGLAINEVAITGHAHTLESEVFRAIGPLDRSILSWDMAAAKRRIEALPWVETVTLNRLLPDKLKVAITERRPVAAWSDRGEVILVDRQGRKLGLAGKDAPSNLVHIAGDAASDAVNGLLAALDHYPAVAARLQKAEWRGRRRWDLELASGLVVKLAADRIEIGLRRLAAFERAHAELAQRASIVDLRLADRIAVAPNKTNTKQAAPAKQWLAPSGASAGGARG